MVRLNHEEATLNGWSDSESPLGHPQLLVKLVRRAMLVSRGVVRGAIRSTDRIVSHIKRNPHPNCVDVERGRRAKSVERANLHSTQAPGSVDKALEEYIPVLCKRLSQINSWKIVSAKLFRSGRPARKHMCKHALKTLLNKMMDKI